MAIVQTAMGGYSTMKNLLITVLTIASYLAIAGESKQEDHFKILSETNGLPPDLAQAYNGLVEALKSGDEVTIAKHSDSNVITVSTLERNQISKEIGQPKEINLAFAKHDFNPTVLVMRKDSDTKYLIRTATSAFWFTKTADGEWKLSDYIDKPIE